MVLVFVVVLEFAKFFSLRLTKNNSHRGAILKVPSKAFWTLILLSRLNSEADPDPRNSRRCWAHIFLASQQ